MIIQSVRLVPAVDLAGDPCGELEVIVLMPGDPRPITVYLSESDLFDALGHYLPIPFKVVAV